MESHVIGARAVKFFAAALAALLIATVCWPVQQAYAYFSKPAVGVYIGASSLSLSAGGSQSVSVAVDMWSEQQLPGCGMSVCPQQCGGLVNPSTGELGGCLSPDGWCQCTGTTYYTAYTQLSVSSSNPSVARGVVNGGVLTVYGYSEGSATITVHSSLSKHEDGAGYMNVTVAAAPSSGGSASGGSGGGSAGTGSGLGSGSGGSGGVSVSNVGTSATAAAAASASEGQKVVEIEAEDGSKVIVVEATDAATAAEELAKIKGTEGTCTFWSGGTLDSPSISWTFKGADLAEDADLSIDPTVSVSKKGIGDVAALLADAGDAIVMDFAHTGALPAAAEVFVRASGVYEDGTKLGLYTYNEDAKAFELVEEGVEVSDGYAVFFMDHCSVWALSAEDLSALEMPAGSESFDATTVNVQAADSTPYLVGAGIVVVVIAAAVAGVVVARRRKAAAVAGDSGAAGVGAGAAGDAGASADERAE